MSPFFDACTFFDSLNLDFQQVVSFHRSFAVKHCLDLSAVNRFYDPFDDVRRFSFLLFWRQGNTFGLYHWHSKHECRRENCN